MPPVEGTDSVDGPAPKLDVLREKWEGARDAMFDPCREGPAGEGTERARPAAAAAVRCG